MHGSVRLQRSNPSRRAVARTVVASPAAPAFQSFKALSYTELLIFSSSRGGKMASEKAGGKLWIVPDCFLPAQSTGDLKSHESTCVLNIGKKPATLNLTAYFEQREPMEGFQAVCPPRRTNHIRLRSEERRVGKE